MDHFGCLQLDEQVSEIQQQERRVDVELILLGGTKDDGLSFDLVAERLIVAETDEQLATHWSQRPSGTNWDPAQAVRWGGIDRADREFVRLGELVRSGRQGVFSKSLDEGDVRVRTIGVRDIQPVLAGEGERRLVSESTLRRHLASDGDVLVSRVGRLGKASCVTESSASLVPRDSVFVLTPKKKSWGAGIAAALCSSTVRGWMSDLFLGSRQSSLTLEQLMDIPVPQPSAVNLETVNDMVQRAGQLVSDGTAILTQIRGEVEIQLEHAPVETLAKSTFWLDDIDEIRAWAFQDVRRYWTRRRARRAIKGLQPLSEAVDLAGSRAKTAYGDPTPPFTIDSDDIRSHWYLALPRVLPTETTDKPGSRRFFAVDQEALLVSTMGNVAAAPVLVPKVVIEEACETLMVPISWLPFIGLRHPRSLAVVMDHPFLQLQRRLGSAFSTVAHITREEIESLLVPSIPNDTLDDWEAALQQAQDKFIEASRIVDQVLAIAEEWYR